MSEDVNEMSKSRARSESPISDNSAAFIDEFEMELTSELVEAGEQEQQRTLGPAFMQNPRNAKLFRVLMERELGIDWEHSFLETEPKSLQTEYLQDGYQECRQTLVDNMTSQR
jgi:hypothetical protein